MKKKEEPNATKEEIKTENNQPRKLTEDELAQINGGSNSKLDFQLASEYITTMK